MFKNKKIKTIILSSFLILIMAVIIYKCDNRADNDTTQKPAALRIYDEDADKKELQKVLKSLNQNTNKNK